MLHNVTNKIFQKHTDNFLFQPWCSTFVDDNGHHVGGQGKWGNCGPGCPIPPDDRASPPVPGAQGKTIVVLILLCVHLCDG